MKIVLQCILAITLMFSLTACSKDSTAPEPESSESPTIRIYFDESESSTSTYKEHVADLWEQTKPVLREDLDADYSENDYRYLGSVIENQWSSLQIHASIYHEDERDAAHENSDYADLIENIKDLINKVYGHWATTSDEERDAARERLRNGELERKISDFDDIINAEE